MDRCNIVDIHIIHYLPTPAYRNVSSRQIRYALGVVSNFDLDSDHFVDSVQPFGVTFPKKIKQTASVYVFVKTGFGFLSAARFWSTLFHVAIITIDGEKNSTPSGKIVLLGPHNR